MNSLNKAQVIGNLTRSPEFKTTTGGHSVCRVGVATNRSWKDSNGQKKEEVEFHNVVVWGKLAEICQQYLTKGMKVFFDGRLQTNSWQDESGAKHYRTEIVAQDMIILSRKQAEMNHDFKNEIKDKNPEDLETVSESAEIGPEDLPF